MLQIDIWSDVACPFCYIGKRKLEMALAEAGLNAQITWHSFQLDPDMKHVPGKSLNEMLAEKKGWTLDHAGEMNRHVIGMAKEVWLDFHLDIAQPANTFDAHRMIHLAAKHHMQSEAKEELLEAYFSRGENVSDKDTLLAIGGRLGLPSLDVLQLVESDLYTDEVNQDMIEASRLGIRGVPFFVFNRKLALSGAQPTEVFMQAFQQALS